MNKHMGIRMVAATLLLTFPFSNSISYSSSFSATKPILESEKPSFVRALSTKLTGALSELATFRTQTTAETAPSRSELRNFSGQTVILHLAPGETAEAQIAKSEFPNTGEFRLQIIPATIEQRAELESWGLTAFNSGLEANIIAALKDLFAHHGIKSVQEPDKHHVVIEFKDPRAIGGFSFSRITLVTDKGTTISRVTQKVSLITHSDNWNNTSLIDAILSHVPGQFHILEEPFIIESQDALEVVQLLFPKGAQERLVAETNAAGIRSELRKLPSIDPTTLEAWGKLLALAKTDGVTHLRELFAKDADRATTFAKLFDSNGVFMRVDYSKQRVTHEVMRVLFELAEQAQLPNAIEPMFSGQPINETENRAVLHRALRNPIHFPIQVDGKNITLDVHDVLKRMRAFVDLVNSGRWEGHSKKRITDVVNIGIGGSHLGPDMVSEALKPYATGKVRVHFVSNVDGTDIAEKVFKKLDPETTLFIVASKTFTTQETMTNAESAKQWILQAFGGDQAAVAKHFVAVSTNEKKVKEFGIDPANMFEFWDWVGGRFSLWSSIGLSIATFIGFDNFQALLDGAFDMDEHFRFKPLEENIPVILALISIWNTNFLGAKTHAILPYDQHLAKLPDYLQQGMMESNGKRIDRSGNPIVGYTTSPVIWGAAGTNGQHSFYQLLHQGAGQLIPATFIAAANSQNPLSDHHAKLLSNYLGQTRALAFGKTEDEVVAEGTPRQLAAHKTFPGNIPTTSILLNRLDPRTLGALIAMIEHQIFVEGVIYNIFSFDQWGVELGKVEANKLLPLLTDPKADLAKLDASTRRLVEEIRRLSARSELRFYEHELAGILNAFHADKLNEAKSLIQTLEAKVRTDRAAIDYVLGDREGPTLPREVSQKLQSKLDALVKLLDYLERFTLKIAAIEQYRAELASTQTKTGEPVGARSELRAISWPWSKKASGTNPTAAPKQVGEPVAGDQKAIQASDAKALAALTAGMSADELAAVGAGLDATSSTAKPKKDDQPKSAEVTLKDGTKVSRDAYEFTDYKLRAMLKMRPDTVRALLKFATAFATAADKSLLENTVKIQGALKQVGIENLFKGHYESVTVKTADGKEGKANKLVSAEIVDEDIQSLGLIEVSVADGKLKLKVNEAFARLIHLSLEKAGDKLKVVSLLAPGQRSELRSELYNPWEVLAKQDPDLFGLLVEEAIREQETFTMIASENHTPDWILAALAHVINDKYAEGYPGVRYYGGNVVADKIEKLAIARWLQAVQESGAYLGAGKIDDEYHVNVQPHSGSQANAAVLAAVLKPGDKILGLKLAHGGHLTHGYEKNASGIVYQSVQFGVDISSGKINYDEVEALALKELPRLLIIGTTGYTQQIDWARMREIADKVSAARPDGKDIPTLLVADVAHNFVQILAGDYNSPFGIADFVTLTPHKSQGPRSGLIYSRKAVYPALNARMGVLASLQSKKSLSDLVDMAIIPGLQGGPKLTDIAAKAAQAKYFASEAFKQYAKQVRPNAKALAEQLMARGAKLVADGTDVHLVLVDTRASFGLMGLQAQNALESIGIVNNRNTIPVDEDAEKAQTNKDLKQTPLKPAGIRLGVHGVTARGLREDEVRQLADIIVDALKNTSPQTGEISDPSLKQALTERVRVLTQQFPIHTDFVNMLKQIQAKQGSAARSELRLASISGIDAKKQSQFDATFAQSRRLLGANQSALASIRSALTPKTVNQNGTVGFAVSRAVAFDEGLLLVTAEIARSGNSPVVIVTTSQAEADLVEKVNASLPESRKILTASDAKAAANLLWARGASVTAYLTREELDAALLRKVFTDVVVLTQDSISKIKSGVAGLADVMQQAVQVYNSIVQAA